MRFPKNKKELAKHSADELRALRSQIVEAAKEAGDTIAADGADDALVTELAEAKALLEQVDTELAARKELADKASALAAELAVDPEPEADEDDEMLAASEVTEPAAPAEPQDTEADDAGSEPEQVAPSHAEDIAAAVSKALEAATDRILSKTAETKPAAATPAVSTRNEPVVQASSTSGSIGTVVVSEYAAPQSFGDVADLFTETINGLGKSDFGKKTGAITLASVKAQLPGSRISEGMSPQAVTDVLDSVMGREALTAAGGLCAPAVVDYSIQTLGKDMQPVGGILPTIPAERGSISFFAPMLPSTITAGVGNLTVADDIANVAKVPFEVPCPTTRSCEIETFYRYYTFGNMSSRALPEHVAANLKNIMVVWAKLLETDRLDKIKAASLARTTTAFNSLMGHLPQVMRRIAQEYRSFYREPDMQFRVLFPSWVGSAAWEDFSRAANDRFQHWSVDEARNMLDGEGIHITEYVDSPSTGTAQVFAAPSTTDVAYPSNIQWGMYPEGTFGRLDFGSLDLGVIRDTSLIATNKYRIFFEQWENVCWRGIQPVWMTTPVSTIGTTTAAI